MAVMRVQLCMNLKRIFMYTCCLSGREIGVILRLSFSLILERSSMYALHIFPPFSLHPTLNTYISLTGIFCHCVNSFSN